MPHAAANQGAAADGSMTYLEDHPAMMVNAKTTYVVIGRASHNEAPTSPTARRWWTGSSSARVSDRRRRTIYVTVNLD